jgi:two-component system, OmpR family, sensor histidine kinase CiaH
MFRSARLKLTAWYLLIIMLISIFFSLGIYNVQVRELERFRHVPPMRAEDFGPNGIRSRVFVIDESLVDEAENRLQWALIFINIGILVVSGWAGYFLAGRTLSPIQEMVDEQNRFITDASHELRTPITSLKSEIEVNLRDRNLKLKDAKALLLSNLEEVNNLQYLSDNLIKLSQNQKVNNEFVYLNLKEIINHAIKKVGPKAKLKKVSIKTKDLNHIITGDSQSLVELFTILLDNAIKYSPSKARINITTEDTRTGISVLIKDQGIGIPPKDIPHLFDRFYRSDKARSEEGYGLGLSIAKKIVESHSGSIDVKSRQNVGTTFFVNLPL